jgi:hypothetical protein
MIPDEPLFVPFSLYRVKARAGTSAPPIERKVREYEHGDRQESEEGKEADKAGKEAGADSSAMAPWHSR